MTAAVLLLGHGKKHGMELVKVVSALGLRPVAAAWDGFSPRSFGRDRPELILADVDQPGAAEMESFCCDVRRRWGQAYPVIAVSASTRFRDVSGLLDAGASDCLAKTAPPELVERKILRALAGAPGAFPGDGEEPVPESLAELFAPGNGLVKLGDLASVHSGAAPRRPGFRRMAPPDGEWRGVMTSEAVDRFFVGKPDQYLRWSRFHLFRLPDPAEYAVAEKVLLRRAGPPLAAAVDRSRLPAGADVYAAVPREGVGAGFLACLLNSRLMDFYFNRLAAVSRDGRLRPEVLRDVPVPRPTPAANQELGRLAALLAHYGPRPESWIDRQSKDELLEQMENAVFDLYGADRSVGEELAALHF
jgi:CheY-like chemotaxis protein